MTTTNAQRHRGGPHDTTAHFCCGQHNYYRHDRSDKQISTSDKKNDRIDEKNVPMLPFFPKFDTERVYGNRVRIIWFEPMFSQSSYNMEQVAMSSNACTLIAVLMAINVHQMQVILNEEYLSSRMIGCLGHSMLEGNKIYESLKIRKMLKHSNLNVPEAIQHASQPNNGLKEWKVIVVMQPLAKALFEHLKSNWIEWTKQFDKYDCYHRDLYIILIADARSVLFCIQYNSDMRHVYAWALDHRVHHKYSETDADPHNAKRGFFFSHVGWLVVTPHPSVIEKREAVDMSDLEEDAIVMWQKRLYPPLFFIFNIFLPVYIPMYFWNETLWNSFWISFNMRFCITLNIAFFVNSVAHMWGAKPYDKYISPVENLGVALATLGEGWHNYHHVFPWDYKTGELGNAYNPSTTFIDFFARIGWAYDLKSVSRGMIARRARKTGDGSHVWGYGDEDIEQDDLEELKNMAAEKEL